jgi:hypothetical protein
LQGIQAAVSAVEQLCSEPIKLIPMKPTQEKATRDDMRYGMQKALKRIQALIPK